MMPFFSSAFRRPCSRRGALPHAVPCHPLTLIMLWCCGPWSVSSCQPSCFYWSIGRSIGARALPFVSLLRKVKGFSLLPGRDARDGHRGGGGGGCGNGDGVGDGRCFGIDADCIWMKADAIALLPLLPLVLLFVHHTSWRCLFQRGKIGRAHV